MVKCILFSSERPNGVPAACASYCISVQFSIIFKVYDGERSPHLCISPVHRSAVSMLMASGNVSA
jgi:hypothetical protein